VKNEEGVYEDMFDNKVVMIDEQTHILLIKSDAETGDGLAGAKFDILDAEGNVVTSVVSKKNGLAIDGVLAVNQTYTFHETSAPKGYKTAEDMTVTIKDTADTQEIEIEDEHIPDKPDVPQTGKESFPFILSLIGAGLILSGFFGARSQIRVKTKDKDK
ncbi:MAG: LPXTG cell wall anchor domain-containing protein, partial [Eubacterium sp.]|nr:LPXTG cell wall anchor domain-containing protein [Eubacterium sp.]